MIFLATYVVPTKDYIIPRIPARRTSLPVSSLFSIRWGKELRDIRTADKSKRKSETGRLEGRIEFENQLISRVSGERLIKGCRGIS